VATRYRALKVAHPLLVTEDVYGKLFKDVGRNEEGVQCYFSARAARLGGSPVLAFDSTTISTYSENQSEARKGLNKDGDGLNTIKLLTLYSVKVREPMAFAKQPREYSGCHIPHLKTIGCVKKIEETICHAK
jgi:hypothetical protein